MASEFGFEGYAEGEETSKLDDEYDTQTIEKGDIVAISNGKVGMLAYVSDTLRKNEFTVIPVRYSGGHWIKAGPVRTKTRSLLTKVPAKIEGMQLRL